MKKLFNGRFLFILASSLIVLILLVVGAFFLFNDEDDKFVKSGYVLNPLSSTAEKYFFDENVGYKENLSSMIEFVDVDEKTVSILKDSFIHYNDESLSFMKKGAILDLDSVKGDSPVAFYNITSESIIERNGDSYTIDSANGDIKLDNFIGRISENKYIVVGDLSLKMVGNSADIKGEYFEIVYVEEGIVNIENKDIKYQVAADGTVINVGNDKVIDLGDKKISVNGADAMSITAITINGDENIEIIPGAVEEEDDDRDNSSGNGDDLGQDNQTGTGENAGNGNGDNQAGEDNPGDNDDTTDEDDKETKKLEITLVPEKTIIDSSRIGVAFKIENALEDDYFSLRVTHLETETTMNIIENIVSDTPDAGPYFTTGLESSTKYMFRIINNKNDQTVKTWIFETVGFGVNIEKEYATSYSLAFNVYVDEKSGIDDADIILERFDDSDNVMDFVSDINGDEKIDSDEGKKTLLTGCNRVESGKYSCVFGDVDDKLKSDSIYRVKMNNFKSGQYTTGVEIPEEVSPVSVMTLKKRPKFAPEEMTATTNKQQDKFVVDIGSVEDEDNSIINYTYLIYEFKDNTLSAKPVMTIPKKDNSSFSIDIAKGNETATTLSLGKTYKYRVVVEYFDNEKYYEFVSPEISDEFFSGEAPTFTIEQDEDAITDKSIGATIKITDIGCKLPMSGRTGCGGSDTKIIVRVTEYDEFGTQTGYSIDKTDVPFISTGNGNILEGTFELSEIKDGKNLQPGYRYVVDVYAEYDSTHPGDDKILYVGDAGLNTIFTKTRASFDVTWNEAGLISDEENVINTSIQLTGSTTNDSTMDFAATADKIKVIEVSIYRGDTGGKKDSEFLGKGTWKDTDDFDIKTNFFDNKFNISSSDFNLSYELLKSKNREENGEYVNQYYTLVVDAWYDDGKDSSELVTLGRNKVYRYMVSPNLLREIEVDLKIKEISHAERKLDMNQYLNSSSTTVGYGIDIGFDWDNFEQAKNWIPKNIYINVYHYYNNIAKDKLDFYYLDENGELKKTTNKTYKYSLEKGSDDPKISLHSTDRIVEIFMDPGTLYDNENPDNMMMTRGNYFIIGYEIEYEYTTDDGKKTRFFETPVSVANSSKFVDNPEKTGTGIYVGGLYVEKEKPHLIMWPLTSDASSITYQYELSDPDNALYKEEGGYYFHSIANGVSKTYLMEEVEGSLYNKFSGQLKIDELSNEEILHGMSYSYYYKMNTLKTGKPVTDIKDVIDGVSPANRKFDGEYKLADNADTYGFSYSLDYDDERTNNLIINFSSMNGKKYKIFDRILSFNVQLKDKRRNEVVYKLDDATLKDFINCPGTTTPMCLSIDYTKIKNMKSTTDDENPITVTVTAIYDNGLTGYDLLKSDEYPYMIMQDNSTETNYGDYITHNYTGEKLTRWKNEPYEISKNESVIPAKGYYVWREREIGGEINYYYTNKRFSSFSPAIFSYDDLAIDANGRKYKGSEYKDLENTYFNPKMVSEEEVPCSNSNEFKFYIIEPKIKVIPDTKLINGFIVDLKLSSFDTDSVKNEGTSDDPKYYVYVETWDYDNAKNAYKVDESNIYKDTFVGNTARPRVKIEVDKNGKVMDKAIIDGLLDIDRHPKEYYYGIYAYMLEMDDNNNLVMGSDGKPLYVYKRIADADNIVGYVPKSYTSTVAEASDLYNYLDYRHDPALDYDVNPFEDREFKYGDRILSMTFNLNSYGTIPLNYNINYVLCEKATCGNGWLADKEKALLVKNIENEKFKTATAAHSYVDLSEYKNLEYGKDYDVYVYLEYQHYKSNKTSDMEPFNFLVNINGRVNPDGDAFYMDELIKPGFSYTRSAGVLEDNGSGNYYIDFGINSSDDDHKFGNTTGDQVLKGGIYKIKLQEIIYDMEEPDKEIGRKDIVEGMEGYENFKMQICDAGVCVDYDNYLEHEFSADVLNQNVRMIGLKPQTEYALTAYGEAYLNNYGLTEEEKNVPIDEDVETAYTTNIYGLAFGKANYEISANSWTITFSGSSNLKDNNLVKSIEAEITNHTNGKSKLYTSTKGFEPVDNSNNLKVVIDTDKNTIGTEYTILLRITLNKTDPETEENIVIDSSINRSFAAYKKPYSTTNNQ